jgi:glycosyltransferase involved in cell wall biosynthesis
VCFIKGNLSIFNGTAAWKRRKRLRILFVAPNIPVPGTHGGSTHVTEVVRALRRDNDVLLLARRGSTGEGVAGVGGRLLPGPLRYLLPVIHFPVAWKSVKKFRPDVIYERFSAFGLGAVLGRKLGIPVVAMVLDKSASPVTYRWADRLITTAPHLVPEKYSRKVEKVCWGANTELFHPDNKGGVLREKHGLSEEEFLIGYMGAFYPWHGLETLVEAAVRLEHTLPVMDFRFLLVGDGQMREQVERLVREKSLAHRFLFPGRVPYESVPDYLAAVDICVAPYNPEKHKELRRHGMFFDPLKVFESLAAGKATITLDSENMRHLFENGRHALLVGPGDADGLAQAIARLAVDEKLRTRLGHEGRKITVTKYSWQAHGDQLSRIFHRLLEVRNRGGR